MIAIKLSLVLCLLVCYIDFSCSSGAKRKKRDNEAILYGNQQGSSHLSVKKSGPKSVESEMGSTHSEKPMISPRYFDEAEYFMKKKLMKRAKRTLIKRSLENGMGPAQMMKRKKRYVEDIDPVTLAKLQDVLANAYDSYYDDRSKGELESPYSNSAYVVEEPEYDAPSMESVQKRSRPEIEDDDDKIAYEIVEVNGVPGLFFPLGKVSEEKRSDYRKRSEDLDEYQYNSKLEKLAEMLASNSK